MAVFGDNNISLNAVKAEIGESTFSLILLCQSANWNKWAFFRGRRIKANTTTKAVELVSVGPYRLGDARRYDHTANEPTPFNNIGTTKNWGPGGGTTDVVALVNLETMNVKEIAYYDSASYDYIQIDLYSTSGDRTAGTNKRHTQKFAISYSTISPPLPDHTIDIYGITQIPNSPQLVTLTNVPTAYSHYYADTYIANSVGTRKINFDDGYSDWNMHEFQSPIIKSTALQVVPSGLAPNGNSWIAAFIITNIAATPFGGSTVDVPQSLGNTNYIAYVYILGTAGANGYALGVTDCIITMSGMGSTFNAYSGAIGHSSTNTTVSGTLPASQTWQYDNIGFLDSDIVAGDYNGNTTLIY